MKAWVLQGLQPPIPALGVLCGGMEYRNAQVQ